MVSLAGKVEPEDVPRKGLRMDLEQHLDDRDPALVGVLQAMTEPNPDERPQSARKVIEMLAKAKPRNRLAMAREQSIKESRSINSPQVVNEPDKVALARIKRSMSIRNSFDDVGEFLADVPKPFSWLLRAFLFTFALSGYLSLAVSQLVLLPIIFAIVGAASSDSKSERIAATRTDIDQALTDGRSGFRGLARRSVSPSGDDPKQLPKPK